MLTYRGQFHYASCGLRERNQLAFGGIECSPLKLELLILCFMYDWMAALTSHSFSTLEEILDLCNFR